MATRIGIMAEIGLDGRGFQAGILKAEKTLDRFARGMATKLAGMFSAGAIINFGRQILDWVGNMKDFADSTGMSAEQVQLLSMAAKQTGVTLEDVTAMLKGLAAARQTAMGELSGTGKLGLFEQLGFSRESVGRMGDSYEALRQIGGAIASLPPGLSRSRIAAELLGRSGAKALAFLGTEFDSLLASMRDSGGILSDREFARIDEYGDKMAAMFEQIKVIAASTAVGVMAPFERMMQGVSMDPTSLIGKFAKNLPRAMMPALRISDLIGQALGTKDAVRQAMIQRSTQPGMFGMGMMGMGLEIMRQTIGEGIAQAYADPNVKAAAKLGFAPSTDELARIGGFIGGTGNSQVNILRNIERYVGRTAVAGEQTVRKLENL